MPKKGSPEDYSVEELRRLLVEKRRSTRQDRLERFRKTGRVVSLAPEFEANSLESMRSNPVEEENPAHRPRLGRLRPVFDALLLIVEIGAVVGLIFVIFNGLEILRTLNQEFSTSLVQPTLTPTPLIQAVVLPSGHMPPDSPGGTRENEAEIPEHLRPLVQSLAAIPAPTQGPSQAIRIQIPTIRVDAPVVMGDGWEQLKKGVGQHIGSANPGDENNIVLAAHNDVFGMIFRDLDQLKPGDQVILYTAQQAYTYLVIGSKIVEPNQVEVMAPTTEGIATLISCYPYMVDNKRIVVTARLEPGE